MHPIEALWARHHPATGYPTGVLPVPAPIPGVAFFPGGFGLWRPDPNVPLPALPMGGIMVLGHDFHSEEGYYRSFALGREPAANPTWRNLLALLDRAGIARERCFFTNFYMGLRAGRQTTGPFPGKHDLEFAAHCRRFFIEQLTAQRPSIVLVLGIEVPPLIGALAGKLSAWSQGRGLRHLDSVGPVRTGVIFDGLPDHGTAVVALAHPCLWHASVRHRRYRGITGAEAEIAMLKDVCDSVLVSSI